MKAPVRIAYSMLLLAGLLPANLHAQAGKTPDKASITAVTPYADSSEKIRSYWKIGLAYASNVLSAGRDYGIKQFSLTPSLEYNHRSGWYTGLSGCYMSEAEPAYTATSFYTGYSNIFHRNWLYDFSYSHVFFHPDSNSLINNSLSAGLSYSKKWFSAGLGYMLLFGEEKAHQLSFNAGTYLEKEIKKGWVQTITFSPGITALFGTANIPLQQIPLSQYKRGTGETWQAYKARLLARRGRNGSSNSTTYDFGLMNWEFNAPVSFYCGSFQFTLSYTYNIPVALPEEESASLSPQGFFGAKVAFTFP